MVNGSNRCQSVRYVQNAANSRMALLGPPPKVRDRAERARALLRPMVNDLEVHTNHQWGKHQIARAAGHWKIPKELQSKRAAGHYQSVINRSAILTGS
jgi:hypothetical protein